MINFVKDARNTQINILILTADAMPFAKLAIINISIKPAIAALVAV